jgi:hypothetical protein
MAHTHATEKHVKSAVMSGNNRRDAASDVLCAYAQKYITRPTEFSPVEFVQYSGMKRVGWRVS